MCKLGIILLPTLIMALSGTVVGNQSSEKDIVDAVGRAIKVPVDPRRVVSLAPSITEIVFALDQQSRLKGVTRYSDYPPEALDLPKVGSYIQLDVERIAALKPDLCIGIKDGNPIAAVQQLQEIGIPVFAVDPIDLESVMSSVLAIGDLLGAETRARALVSEMRARIEAITARTTRTSRKPRVFFQIGVMPIVSVGSNTFIDKLISLAGGTNVAGGPSPYPRFSREQVIGLAPEVMIISSMDRAAAFEQVREEWLQWPAIPAVKNQAVFIAPTNVFDRPTPRLVEGLELLARFVHPELFEGGP